MADEAKGRSSVPSGRLAAFLAEIGDVPTIADPQVVRRRSRDFFWYSPILNAELHGKSADVVVTPRHEADVIAIARAAARQGVPVTPRGGGTGNYGQAVPLQGGALVDFSTMMNHIVWSKPGVLRVQAGAKMGAIDDALRPSGWELRMHPSTKRTATIGGFVAGGSGGVGSIVYGGLRDPGNIGAARIVTIEREPRVIELRADAAQRVNRAFGTTGLITELEMPLSPAWRWIDIVLAYDDFHAAVETGYAMARADGVVKKLLTPIAWPIPAAFSEIKTHCPAGKSLLIAMIAEPSIETFRTLVGKGIVTYEAPADESAGKVPLYEYCWNHTTLHMLKGDRSITYLQCLFPYDRLIETVRKMVAIFGDEVLHHLEFSRYAGHVTASALPIVRFTNAERLNEIIGIYEANGVFIANPHVYTLEDGSRYRRADADQYGFKTEVDPYGLLNPGKMKSFVGKPWAPA
jgi:FAD/FMN-containing dehydrogenase